MKHLSFEQARQEATIYNALVVSGVIDEKTELPNDEAIKQGLSKLVYD